jgi:hypothetical protein
LLSQKDKTEGHARQMVTIQKSNGHVLYVKAKVVKM